MNWRQLGRWIALFLGGLLFFWLVVLKAVSRTAAKFGRSAPCPASLSWLVDNRWRKRSMRHVLDWVGIQGGEQVLELGPGPGAFTVEAARLVGPCGRIIAVDIQAEMMKHLQRRLLAEGINSVEPYIADACSLPLEDDSIDRAFLISVLPEIAHPPQALAEIKRVLKPEGILSITAEFTDPDYLFLGETINLLEESGFSLVEWFGNFWLYTANFRRRSDRAVGSSYYVLRKRRLQKEFDGVVERVGPMMLERYGPSFVDVVSNEARQQFELLIPQIPYIGGRRNSFTRNLVQSAWSLALFRTMVANGCSTEEVGRLLIDIYTSWLNETPEWQLRIRSWFAFTPIGRWHLNRRARRSQKRLYPGDWVFKTVSPNGHDISLDYTECGIYKFYQEQNSLELLPFLCSSDFILSERLNLGLTRTSTLADGSAVCDFRFRRGHHTKWTEQSINLLGR